MSKPAEWLSIEGRTPAEGAGHARRAANAGRFARRWLDVLLPMRCLLCGGPATADNACTDCLDDMPWNIGACPGCALPATVGPGGRCESCRANPPPWDHVTAAMRYGFPADRLVRRLKFGHDLAAGRVLAAAMRRHPPCADGGRQTLIVPVPLHWIRHWRRGHNQAAELAVHLRVHTGWPMSAAGLRRVRHTRAQSRLGARARRTNLDGAFRWRGMSLRGVQIVLVDDVMTTGTTLAACARALRRAGADEVFAWVAARALTSGQSATSAQRS